MPPKKQLKSDTNDMCFYNHVPENFLDEVLPNPNIKNHNFTIPFRAVVVAPSGSGKTSFVANLIKLFSAGKGTFSNICIICADKDEPIYKYLASISDAIQVKEGLHSLPDLAKADKETSTLVVIDDQQNQKNQTRVEEYYIRCRKKSVSICYLCQNYYISPIVIRRNCNYVVILKLSGEKEVKCLLKEVGLGLSKENLLNMYKFCTNDKFNTMIIDCESNDVEHKYRHNFTEYLSPSHFN
jgi:hypothetical protein